MTTAGIAHAGLVRAPMSERLRRLHSEGETCTSSEECCNGLSCTDFQCFRD